MGACVRQGVRIGSQVMVGGGGGGDFGFAGWHNGRGLARPRKGVKHVEFSVRALAFLYGRGS